MRHEEAPRPGGSGGQKTAGEDVPASVSDQPTTVTPATGRIRRAGDPVVTRRRHARAVDEHLANDPAAGYVLTAGDVLSLLTGPPVSPSGPACGGAHSGPCDRWSTCTGMILDAGERDSAGRVHPWRLVA